MWPLLLALLWPSAHRFAGCHRGVWEGTGQREVYYLMDGPYCAKWSAAPSAAKQLRFTQISDGAEMVKSMLQSDGQVLECSATGDRVAVRSFMNDCTRRAADSPLTGRIFLNQQWATDRAECQRFLRQRGAATLALSQGDVAPRRVPREARSDGEAVLHRRKRGFTYPGTLWCGSGNNAESYDHLGEFSETDKCCREHDHCAHVIYPLAYSYGHRNFRLHTMSHCDCDAELKQCLRRVNDTTSRIVGQAFFNVLEVPCFDLAYKEQCVERYWYGWCKRYDRVLVAVPRESVLFDYGGDLIDNSMIESKTDASSPTTFSWISSTPSFTAIPGTPKPEATSQQSTLGQVLNAAEDLLKVMATVTQSSAHGNTPGTASSSVNEKVGISLNKAKEEKKKRRKGKKRRKEKGKKKNRKDKSGSKGSKATNVLQVLETKIHNKKDYFTEIEKTGNSNELGQHFFGNSLDSMINRDKFNDVMNDESQRVDSYTQLHKTSTETAAKPNQRFQHYRIEGFTPLLVTQDPAAEFYRENSTAKLWHKPVDGHQSHREGTFTLAPTKQSPNSHSFKKEPSVLTVITPGQYKEETSTPSIIHTMPKEVAINSQLKANHLVPPLGSIIKKQRRKRKGRRRQNLRSQQKSKMTIPTAPGKIIHGELDK
ncbi:uncharacterized protein proca1 [Pristis pectinata]|uniref:uncharacterized protein proca1 n=1 Tax=Pristis pectinata TaxID=685728 RepID=UPI00223E84CC|nr:uncharacterized protein proca1 [Pristis pectinata]